jgi:hypothetical protein
MAINTYRFWMATDTNRLLANQNSFIQASPPSFYQGNVANLELHMVASAGVGLTPIEVPFPAGAEISVAVGNTNSYPTGGSWELSVDDTETEAMPYNATTTQVAAALNALTAVSSVGGVSVSKTGAGYTITWNTYGLKPTIGIGSDTLTPSSYESISLVQTGSANHRQIVFVELRQNPIALSTTWTPLPTPSITSTLIKAWDGVSVIWRVTIYPQPKAGTMTLSYGTKTATLDVSSSATDIATAIEAQVFATGRFQWDVALAEDSTLDVSGNLIGYNGYSGTINFATAECHQFLAGDESRATTIEVSISVDSKRYTLIQSGCEIFADVVSDGVISPLTLGVALSEQVANARFVRRDVDQAPNPSTQDVIWGNLGVVTMGSNIVGAIDGADSPSGANPFATISDIPSVLPAEWGNITGDITNQSDLNFALESLDALKYDKSNPAGFVNQAYLLDYARLDGAAFTGRVTIADGSGPPNLNIGSVLTSGYTLTPGDIWFENGSLNYIIGPSPETVASTVYVEQYVASAGFATESWVNSQGFQTTPFNGGYVYNPIYVYAQDTDTWGATIVANGISFASQPGFYGQNTASYTDGGMVAYLAFFPNFPSVSLQPGSGLNITNASNQTVVNEGQLTYNGVEPYARKDGTTFTGNVNFGTDSSAVMLQLWGGLNIATPGSLDNTVLGLGTGGISFTSNLSTGSCSMNTQGINIVNTAGGVTSIGIGATFQGRVITGSPTSAVAGLNIGSINSTSDLTNSVAGDVWMGTWQMTYKSANGTLVYGAATNRQNVFGAPQIIDTTATTAALRVTQKGTGNAIEVEDSTTPDATRFVVDQFGKVGVGTAPDATAAIRVDANGISFNGLSFNPTGTASHTGGSDTIDLLVTINGVNYRLGLRPA